MLYHIGYVLQLHIRITNFHNIGLEEGFFPGTNLLSRQRLHERQTSLPVIIFTQYSYSFRELGINLQHEILELSCFTVIDFQPQPESTQFPEAYFNSGSVDTT